MEGVLLTSRPYWPVRHLNDPPANQSKNATQEWENFPFSRVPRKRAKARCIRIYLSNEQRLFASISRTSNISSPQTLCATLQNSLFEIILLNREVQIPIPNRV